MLVQASARRTRGCLGASASLRFPRRRLGEARLPSDKTWPARRFCLAFGGIALWQHARGIHFVNKHACSPPRHGACGTHDEKLPAGPTTFDRHKSKTLLASKWFRRAKTQAAHILRSGKVGTSRREETGPHFVNRQMGGTC